MLAVMAIKGKAKENFIATDILSLHILQNVAAKPITHYPKSNTIRHPKLV